MASATQPLQIRPQDVEDVKVRHGFDHELAKALMPLRHPRRRILDEPVLAEQFVDAIRQNIDGHLGRFVAAGARRIPRSLFSRRPKGAQKNYAPRPELDNLLRRFVDQYHVELRGSKPSRSEKRRAAIRIRELVLVIVRRDRKLAEFVTY